MEPLLGSLIGWAGGVVPPPGPWTYGGGALIMGSTAVVSLASHRRELAASKEAASRAIQRILSGSSEASGEGLSSSGAAAEGGGPAGPAAALGLPVRRLAHEGGRPPGDSG